MSKSESTKPFGSVFSNVMGSVEYSADAYGDITVGPLENLTLHPSSHVLHYGSSCFEGLKAHRLASGEVAIFRLDDHVKRFVHSIASLQVTPPTETKIKELIVETVRANVDDVPGPPGSLYIRPFFIGTTENIGSAAAPPTEGKLSVICSPVGDYFQGGIRPLTLLVEETLARTTSQFGRVKAGANYVMALGPTLAAKADHGADQVLFATHGSVTETGAANFLLATDSEIVTKDLDDSFLHGVTRDSILTIGEKLGYSSSQRPITVSELSQWQGEAFLTGTAAVVAPVGTLIIDGNRHNLRDGQPGPNTLKLRRALTDIHAGLSEDSFGWLTIVST